jgi:hypothetical protein
MSLDTTTRTYDTTAATDEREAVRKRLQARREFASHLVAYFVINVFIVAAWAITGGGYFWPAWVIGGWGVCVVLHAWDVFLRRDVTESDIDAALQRHRHDGTRGP